MFVYMQQKCPFLLSFTADWLSHNSPSPPSFIAVPAKMDANNDLASRKRKVADLEAELAKHKKRIALEERIIDLNEKHAAAVAQVEAEIANMDSQVSILRPISEIYLLKLYRTTWKLPQKNISRVPTTQY